MNPITLFLVAVVLIAGALVGDLVNPILIAPFVIAAAIIGLSLKMANVWQRFVILRAGNFHGVKGPGLFFIFPILDNVAQVIDQRIQTTAFNAEQALTKDTVPVNVDAIIFWNVHNAQMVALNITDYRQAIDRVAQTSLREMIGASMLSALLAERKAADAQRRAEIAMKTEHWGVPGQFGGDRDPGRLQTPCPGQAQAEREKQARVILGSAEAEVAAKFVEAAQTYGDHPMAFQLRAMNIIYETTKERGATILIPTAMAMNPSKALRPGRVGAVGGRALAAAPARQTAGRPESLTHSPMTNFTWSPRRGRRPGPGWRRGPQRRRRRGRPFAWRRRLRSSRTGRRRTTIWPAPISPPATTIAPSRRRTARSRSIPPMPPPRTLSGRCCAIARGSPRRAHGSGFRRRRLNRTTRRFSAIWAWSSSSSAIWAAARMHLHRAGTRSPGQGHLADPGAHDPHGLR